jgi:hypothetical protein
MDYGRRRADSTGFLPQSSQRTQKDSTFKKASRSSLLGGLCELCGGPVFEVGGRPGAAGVGGTPAQHRDSPRGQDAWGGRPAGPSRHRPPTEFATDGGVSPNASALQRERTTEFAPSIGRSRSPRPSPVEELPQIIQSPAPLATPCPILAADPVPALSTGQGTGDDAMGRVGRGGDCPAEWRRKTTNPRPRAPGAIRLGMSNSTRLPGGGRRTAAGRRRRHPARRARPPAGRELGWAHRSGSRTSPGRSPPPRNRAGRRSACR